MSSGSKSIDRVGRIMQALEQGPEEGMTTGEIAEFTGFDRATAHRAVVSLERIGFLDRDPLSRRVRLGLYLFSLSSKVSRRFSILSHSRDVVAKLADQTGDTVFLCVRNKFDCVCIERHSGSYPIKAQTLSVGESVPLGMSAAGVAILSAMSDEDVRHAMQYNAVKISEFHRVTPEEIQDHVRESRSRGYACYQGHIVTGMAAVGSAIKDSQGRPVAAITIAALLDRMRPDRIKTLAELLNKEIATIEQRAALVSHGGDFGSEHSVLSSRRANAH